MIHSIYSLTEYDDYWLLPLASRTVSRFRVDNSVSIEFIDPDREYVMIIIEQSFSIFLSGTDHRLSPKERTRLSPLLSLLHRTVDSAVAIKDGTLRVKFETGDRLEVLAHPKYEAWTIAGDYGLRIVCLPGGDLAIWKPDPFIDGEN